MARLSDQTVGVLQVSTATVLLGTLGVCVRESGQDQWVTVWWRCLIGAITIALLSGDFRDTLALPRNVKTRLVTLACGLLMTLTWILFFASLNHLAIAVATVVFQVQPLILMLWGVLVLRERVFLREWTAAVIALAGIALVAAPPLRGSVAGGVSALAGVVLCIGAAGCFTGVTLIARKTTVSPQGLAWWQCVIGAVCLSWVPAVEGFPTTLSGWAWLCDLGAIHTGLAYVLLYAGVRRTTTVQIALLQFISPMAAVLVDWCVYKQTLEPIQLVGLVLAAVALATATRSRDPRSKSELHSPHLSLRRSKIMISRLWRSIARSECAGAYIEHLQQETFPALQRLSGFKRATILNRPCDIGVEFLIVTVWESEQAIVAFAGVDAQAAVVPEKVQRMMVEFDDRTRHFNTIE